MRPLAYVQILCRYYHVLLYVVLSALSLNAQSIVASTASEPVTAATSEWALHRPLTRAEDISASVHWSYGSYQQNLSYIKNGSGQAPFGSVYPEPVWSWGFDVAGLASFALKNESADTICFILFSGSGPGKWQFFIARSGAESPYATARAKARVARHADGSKICVAPGERLQVRGICRAKLPAKAPSLYLYPPDPFELQRAAKAAASARALHFFIALCGLMFFLSATATAQFLLSRDKVYLFYASFTAGNLFYYLIWLFVLPGAEIYSLISPYWMFLLSLPVLLICYACYFHLAIHLLSLPQKHRALHQKIAWISPFLMGCIGISLCVVMPVNHRVFYSVVGNSILAAVILVSIWGVYQISTLRSPLCRLFLIGTSCYLLSSAAGFCFSVPFFRLYLPAWLFEHPIILTGLGSMLEALFVFISLGHRYLIAQEERMLAFQEKDRLTAALASMAETQQNERNRLARDLHDDIGSTLSSINILSNLLCRPMPEEIRIVHLNHIRNYVQEVMNAMNDIIWSVNPLNDSIECLAQKMREWGAELSESAGWSFHFDSSCSHSTSLEPKARHHLLLLYKEALNNAAKYASATLVKVSLRVTGGEICLQIDDNGIGFDVAASRKGNGLKNMQARALDLGGSLNILSEPGRGTQIRLSFPLPSSREEDTQQLYELEQTNYTAYAHSRCPV
jgi:signal transduction histidine kinase